MTEEVGTYVRVWDRSGSCVNVPESEEPRIDAAVSAWISSCGNVDSVLDLTTVSGHAYKVLASYVTSWMVFGPENRRHNVEFEAALEAETKALKQALGVWEDAE